jgi:hypothetical protein
VGQGAIGAIFWGIILILVCGGILLVKGIIMLIDLLITGTIIDRLIWFGAFLGLLLIFFGLLAEYNS